MKKIFEYGADAGSFVINGFGITNHYGDGVFGVYYVEKLPKYAELVKDLWIDLRNGYPITLHGYDCNKNGEEFYPNKRIIKNNFKKYFCDAQALQLAVDIGNIYLVKWF